MVLALIDASGQQRGPLLAAAALYERGDYAAANVELVAAGALRDPSDESRKLAAVLALGGQDGPPRRWMAASVLLEFAHVLFSRSRLLEGRQVMEVACQAMRDDRSEFARVWTLASIALVHGVQNNRATSDAPRARLARIDAEHWDHARRVFPDETRIWFGAVLVRPEVRRLPVVPGVSALYMTEGSSYDGANPDSAFTSVRDREREREASEQVQRTIDDLSRFVDRSDIGPEARLRRGILLFHRNESSRSLEDLAAAAASRDVFISYLGHLYQGLLHQSNGDMPAAIERFTAALRLVPGSAVAIHLSAALFASGQRAAAFDVLPDALAIGGNEIDPWRAYTLGDYRLWSQYLERLRRELRP